jgi:hypothetical protein
MLYQSGTWVTKLANRVDYSLLRSLSSSASDVRRTAQWTLARYGADRQNVGNTPPKRGDFSARQEWPMSE